MVPGRGGSSWRATAARSATRIAQRLIGRSIDDSIRIYEVRLGLPASNLPRLRTELVDLAEASYATTSDAAVRELVEALRGRLPVAVASNTDRSLVEGALAGAGSGSFDAIVTADDVTRPKPPRTCTRSPVSASAMEPSAAIAFEDSTLGVRSARAAGLYVVAVPSFEDADVSEADLDAGVARCCACGGRRRPPRAAALGLVLADL